MSAVYGRIGMSLSSPAQPVPLRCVRLNPRTFVVPYTYEPDARLMLYRFPVAVTGRHWITRTGTGGPGNVSPDAVDPISGFTSAAGSATGSAASSGPAAAIVAIAASSATRHVFS